jgi:hypothetical protein
MKKLSLAIALGLASVAAQAAPVCGGGICTASTSFGLAKTNWVSVLSLPQFDPSVGILTGVKFDYSGLVETTFKVESLDAAPANLTLSSSAGMAFSGLFADSLAASGGLAIPVGIFDGVIDFGGTSGASPAPVVGSDSDSLIVAGPSFAAYTGLGNLPGLTVAATGLSNASGAGNLISQIGTEAKVNVMVTYTYRDNPPVQVPEPGSLALVGLALAAAGVAARRKA